jgi:hypothetical protein
LFARNVHTANIEKLQNEIINRNNARDIYSFAIFVPGANLDKLYQAIQKTEDSKFDNWTERLKVYILNR